MITTRYNPPGIFILGKRWEFKIPVREKAIAPATVGPDFDLTDATVTMVINGGTPQVATLADQSTERGVATVVYLPSETALMADPALTGGQYFYYVEVEFSSAIKDWVAAGSIRARKP